MAFVVTSVVTKTVAGAPDFDTWTNSMLDPDVVYAEYPNLRGMTMGDIVNNQVNTFIENAENGFISQESISSDDGSVWTLKTVWESQGDYEAAMTSGRVGIVDATPGNIVCATDSTTVTGINTFFTTNLSVGDSIVIGNINGDNNLHTIGTISSIESDTSLTLESNAAYNINNRRYNKLEKVTALAFIQDLYNAAYPVTEETTYANV